MGVFNCPIRLESMDGKSSLEIEAMVDTGASYTIVPAYLRTWECSLSTSSAWRWRTGGAWSTT